MPSSKQSKGEGLAPTLTLRDGYTYSLENGRVVKLYRRNPDDDSELYYNRQAGLLAPSVTEYPWAAHIDREPRAGGKVLHFTAEGKVWEPGNPFGQGQGDILTGQFANSLIPGEPERLIPEDRRHAALHRLVKARAQGVPEEIWVCQDGRQMLVSEMSEDHLRNTLRMIIRNARVVQEARRKSSSLAQELEGTKSLREEAEREFWDTMGEDRKWGSD